MCPYLCRQLNSDGHRLTAITLFKEHLNTCFHMKDLDSLKYFFGIEVGQNSSCLYLSQRKYAFDIISKIRLSSTKPAPTPIDQTHHLAIVTEPFMASPERYRKLIGQLIYLTINNFELAHSVHTLA